MELPLIPLTADEIIGPGGIGDAFSDGRHDATWDAEDIWLKYSETVFSESNDFGRNWSTRRDALTETKHHGKHSSLGVDDERQPVRGAGTIRKTTERSTISCSRAVLTIYWPADSIGSGHSSTVPTGGRAYRRPTIPWYRLRLCPASMG